RRGVGVRRAGAAGLSAGRSGVLGRVGLADRGRPALIAPRGHRGAARGSRGHAQPVGGTAARRDAVAAAHRRAHPRALPRARERRTADRDGRVDVPRRAAAVPDPGGPMNALSLILWVAFPYAAIAVFIVRHIWRYRYDKFGWTTRSSQTYENRLLRWGSPMFHFGILMVIVGHAVGLLIPREWLYAIGITEEMYHWGATVLGTFAAVLTLAGLTI